MKRRVALIGFVVTGALAFAACGGGGGGGGGEAAVSIKTLQAASSNTAAAESSRFTLDMTVNAAGHDLHIRGSGIQTGDQKTAQVSIEVPIVGSIEMRMIDGTMYMNLGNLGALSGKLPEGKQWISANLAELGQRTGTDFSQLIEQAQSNGPQQGLKYLQGLSGDVQKVGEDTISGVHTTHYQASIDYAKVAAKLGESSALGGKLAKLGTVPADVWIDDHDRVVKMHFSIDGSAFGAGDGKADLTMEISDFGVPVDVQAPPADQTVDISEITGKFHQSGQPLST